MAEAVAQELVDGALVIGQESMPPLSDGQGAVERPRALVADAGSREGRGAECPPPAPFLRDRGATQGKAAVKLRARRWGRANDITADPQPVRIQIRIADPHLQVTGKHRRSGRGQPQEVAIPTSHLHLRNEEVVTGGQVHRLGEHHVELDGLPRDRTVSPRVLVGRLVDAIDHGVRDNDMVVDDPGGEA